MISLVTFVTLLVVGCVAAAPLTEAAAEAPLKGEVYSKLLKARQDKANHVEKRFFNLTELLPEIIEELKPIIADKVEILLDPNLSEGERIDAIIDIARDLAADVVVLFGKSG